MTTDIEAEGPFTFESPALSAGEAWHLRLKRRDKGRYKRHLPFDEILVKNYDTDNRVDAEINGIYNLDIDPGGKDSDDTIGVSRLVLTNEGSTSISAGDVTVTLKNKPYDADERAREMKQRGPVEGIVKKTLGI